MISKTTEKPKKCFKRNKPKCQNSNNFARTFRWPHPSLKFESLKIEIICLIFVPGEKLLPLV